MPPKNTLFTSVIPTPQLADVGAHLSANSLGGHSRELQHSLPTFLGSMGLGTPRALGRQGAGFSRDHSSARLSVALSGNGHRGRQAWTPGGTPGQKWARRIVKFDNPTPSGARLSYRQRRHWYHYGLLVPRNRLAKANLSQDLKGKAGSRSFTVTSSSMPFQRGSCRSR